ncbi:MAG TPA: radical SAM protein, partial [Armatimonadota bacterium]|nr:radical SAM protein [Armatimonadota bacterium]
MTPPAVRYLVLWVTAACNLRCAYCYRRPGRDAVMPIAVARAALALAAASGQPFHVQLTGGEPTLEPAVIEAVGRMVRQAGWPATLALQTNGTRLDTALIELCRRYDIGIGVSIDGPPEVQERVRGSAAATFRGLRLLERAALPVRVTAVLSSANVARLRELVLCLGVYPNVSGVGLDPVVAAGAARHAEALMPDPEAVRRGVRAMYAAVSGLNRLRARPFQWRECAAVERALAGDAPVRPYCHACRGESLAIHPDGTAYPCAQAVGDPAMQVGDVDAVDWARLRAVYHGVQLRGECAACALSGRCPGD